MLIGTASKKRLLKDRAQLLNALRDCEVGKSADLNKQDRKHLITNIKERIAEIDARVDGEADD